jgi:hypothetical protein
MCSRLGWYPVSVFGCTIKLFWFIYLIDYQNHMYRYIDVFLHFYWYPSNIMITEWCINSLFIFVKIQNICKYWLLGTVFCSYLDCISFVYLLKKETVWSGLNSPPKILCRNYWQLLSDRVLIPVVLVMFFSTISFCCSLSVLKFCLFSKLFNILYSHL